MTYSNIPKRKLPGQKYRQMSVRDMAALVKKTRAVYLDTETCARNFDPQSSADDFLEAYKVRTGKQPTAKTLASARSHAEQTRLEMAVDPKQSAIRLIQIANDAGDVFVFDAFENQEERTDPLIPVLKAIDGKPVCGQNLKFDLKVLLARWPRYRPGDAWDTMIGHKLCRSAEIVGFFHSTLEDVVRFWCGVELEKGHGKDDWSEPVTAEQFEYSVLDVTYLRDCMKKQIEYLNSHCQDPDNPYFDGCVDKVSIIEMRFVEVLAWTELHGIPLNSDRLESRAADLEKELKKIKRPFDKFGVNTQSPLQIIKFLAAQGIDVISTDKEELTKYVNIPIVEKLMRVKVAQKELQMCHDYVHEHMGPDGRVYTSFNQMRATDGRMSSKEFNAQQVPRAVKSIFYQSTKKTAIIKADYPGIEARIMGVVAPDDAVKDIFKSGGDMHTISASEFLGKPESEVTKLERLKAKAANFGFMFGMGALTFVRYSFTNYGLVVSLQEATETREKYLRKYPGIKRFHSVNSRKLQDAREITVRTLLGRRMRVDGFTNANNYPVQGSAADMIKLACVLFFNACRAENLDAKIINIVHDELVVEAPRKIAGQASKALARAMNTAADYVIQEFKTKVEINIS